MNGWLSPSRSQWFYRVFPDGIVETALASRLSGKFHPRYCPVEFAGIFRPGKYAQSGKYGKYGKYDFGLVIM